MTPTAANQNGHPYLRPEQFADRTFLRVRRQVALIRLPYAEGRVRELLLDAIRVYDELING